MRVLALPLPPTLSALDHTMCEKHIKCLSNMAYAMDAQAKSLSKSNTWAISKYRELTLDILKNDLSVSPQKDLMQVAKPALSGTENLPLE